MDWIGLFILRDYGMMRIADGFAAAKNP